MANNENLIPIPGRLHSVATEGHVSGADEIYDDTQQKDQATINSELISAVGTVDSKIATAKEEIIGDAATDYNTLGKLEDKIQAEASRAEGAEEALDGRVDTLEEAVGTGGSVDSRISAAVATETTRAQAAEADRYTKSETYSKTELNNLITTPNQEYVSVIATAQTTAVTDVLPATGAADTTYRVGNWDGTQYNDSVFSEYAWNGSAYIKLSTKSQVGEVYDISVNHADTKYADLTAALGTNGANIPQSLRKGGMSVKFVQSSDNKYVQFRYMSSSTATADFTNVANWQGVDEEPTPNSKNLIESGGVDKMIEPLEAGITKNGIWLSLFAKNSYMYTNGEIRTLNGYDLYEIKGVNPNDIFIIANADGGSVLASGLSINYLCQGKLQNDSYIDLRGNNKNGGAEINASLPYFIIAVPNTIKSIYFTKKSDENKNIVFYRLGGDIISGSNKADWVVASSQLNPINIFDNYKASVYPRPDDSGRFNYLAGYSFAYAKLKSGDVITIDDIDNTNMPTVGWVFTFDNNVVSSTALGIVSEYKATGDCYVCIVNKDSNDSPVAIWKPKEYMNSLGRLFAQTDPKKNYKFVACVLRNVGGTWQQIDGAHKSLNVSSIEQDDTFIKVNYGFTAQNVVSFVACPDEDFANIGYAMGSSVGLEYAQIKITQHYELAMYVQWNGTSWDKYGGVTNVTFNNGVVQITHPSIGGVSGSSSCRGGLYIASLGNLGATTTDVVVKNYNGELVTSLDTGFKLYVVRTSGAVVIKPTNANTSGNIWCFGIMEV